MRGRELPGFTSARLLMGSVSVDLENLRAEVRDYTNITNKLNAMILIKKNMD